MKGGRYLEERHVQKVYDTIAPSFNDLPQKVWPNVKKFIKSLSPGSLVADIGCGNGRYLHINKSVYKFGVDVCYPLVELSQQKGYEVLVADNQILPFRDDCFDAVISIGVLHHFSTEERRVKAVKELCRVLKPGGKLLIYVWAYEQKHRRFDGQDVLVPWHAGKIRNGRGLCSSDQDVSSTSSISEDESIDLSCSDAALPHHYIQRTVSDPACPCCLQPNNQNKTPEISSKFARQRSNTLPSSLEVFNDCHHSNSQIEEECRKLQMSLKKMADSQSHLNDSSDSVFLINTKVEDEEEGIMFETKHSVCSDTNNIKDDIFDNEKSLLPQELCVSSPTSCGLSLIPIDTEQSKLQSNVKKPKKLSFFEAIKKRFLKLIDAETTESDQPPKNKCKQRIEHKTSLVKHDGSLLQDDGISLMNDGNLLGLENFAVREFPMSSCPDYRQQIITEQYNNQNNGNENKDNIQIILKGNQNNMYGVLRTSDRLHDIHTYSIHQADTDKINSCHGSKTNGKISKKNIHKFQLSGKKSHIKSHDEYLARNNTKISGNSVYVNGEGMADCTENNVTSPCVNGSIDMLDCTENIVKSPSVNRSINVLDCTGDIVKSPSVNGTMEAPDCKENIQSMDVNGIIHSHTSTNNVLKQHSINGITDNISENVISCSVKDSRRVNGNGPNIEFINHYTELENGFSNHKSSIHHKNTCTGNNNFQICSSKYICSKNSFADDGNITKDKFVDQTRHIRQLNCSENRSPCLSSQKTFRSCDNLSSQGGAKFVPSPMTKEEFQMSRLCRYYHVFREGELSNLIYNQVDNLSVNSCTYDHGNWCLVAEKNVSVFI